MTTLLVTHTSHFVRGPDDGVYATNRLLGHQFWTRYLAVFETVRVAARVRRVGRPPEGLPRADGAGVEFVDLPDYRGPWQYALRHAELTARLRAALRGCDAVCLRVPCAIATRAWNLLRRERRPFGLEVVGNPRDSLAAGGVRTVLRPLASVFAVRDLRRQCREACAAAYVTRETLQQFYPPSPTAFTTHYSSIDLPPRDVIGHTRASFVGASRLVFVGSLAVRYKGLDVLLRAMARCPRGMSSLTVIGDGRERSSLEQMTRTLNLADRVTFRGTLPAGEAVRRELDAADLFVLPSRADALPRALIEAMARGLPCIASRVGGVPELLAPEDLVTPGSAAELARVLTAMLSDPPRMLRAARRNLERARDFISPVLYARREDFYSELMRRSRQPTSSVTVLYR